MKRIFLLSVLMLCGATADALEILGEEADRPFRPYTLRLGAQAGHHFEEGFLRLNSPRWNPRGLKYSLAFREPRGTSAPIVILIHGATQEKTSFAMVARSLILQNRDIGVAAPDLVGAGETLSNALPVTYEIPVELNATLIHDVVKKIRRAHPRNPIQLVGVSYGAGAIFEAFSLYPELKSVVDQVTAVSFGNENDAAAGEVRVRGGILRALWPLISRRQGSDQDFVKAVTSEIIYTRSAMLEPIVLRPPFPWTLVALEKLTMGIWEPDVAKLERAIPAKTLNVVLSVDETFLNIDRLGPLFASWQSTRSIVFAHNSDHKINESNPNFLASWILRVAANEPAGAYIGYPTDGFAENVVSRRRIELETDEWPLVKGDLWWRNWRKAVLGWTELWVYWNLSPYDWAEYFWSTYMRNLEIFWSDFMTTAGSGEDWLELTLKKWRDAFDLSGRHSVSKGYAEMNAMIARTMRDQINEALDRKHRYAEELAKKSNPSGARRMVGDGKGNN